MRTKAEKIADDVERLHRKGMGRNEIARELGVAQGTVTKAAKLRGVDFDRAQTMAATEAVVHDARASRASLSLRLLSAGHAALDAFNLAIVDPERSGDARNYMTAAAVSVDKHLMLDEREREVDTRSLSAVDAWTAAMLGRDEVPPGRPIIDDPERPWDHGKVDVFAMSEEEIAADVAAEMAAAAKLNAIERTP